MLKRLAWLLCLACALLAVTSNELQAMEEGPPDPAPRGGVVVRVSFADAQDLQQLAARYDVWQVDPQTRQATLWVTLAQWQRPRLLPARQPSRQQEFPATAVIVLSKRAMPACRRWPSSSQCWSVR